MEKLGIIRRSQSTVASVDFVVHKKDGTVRLVVDYRALNKKDYPFPLSSPQDIIADMRTMRYFTSLDLRQEYY